MSRRSPLPIGLVAAALACVLGAVGLVRGLLPEPAGAAAGNEPAQTVPADAVRQGDLAVYGAYVREPASPDTAAAYFSVTNLGDRSEHLTGLSSGAATSAAVHDVPAAGGTASATPADPAEGASVGMTPSGPVEIRPGQTLTLSPGKGHVMLEGLIGPLVPGQQVSLLLTFEKAGQMLLDVPVIAIGAPAPTAEGGS